MTAIPAIPVHRSKRVGNGQADGAGADDRDVKLTGVRERQGSQGASCVLREWCHGVFFADDVIGHLEPWRNRMKASPHVVVIGAGTLGLCSALNLVEAGARVTVIDAQSIASGSSGRSVGVVGTQFTDPFDILLRVHAMRQFGGWERLGLGFHHIGYLRLARTPAQMQLFAHSVEMQKEAGLRSRLYDAQELRQLVPHLSTEGLEGGIFGPDNGFLDPHEMCNFIAERVRARGGEIRQFCALHGVKRRSAGYTLETGKGPLDCDIVVNAAGAWAPAVARLFGQRLHIFPERHEAIVIHLDPPLDYTMPMVMDLVNGEGTGLNFRQRNAVSRLPKSTRRAPPPLRKTPTITTSSSRTFRRRGSPSFSSNACRICQALASAGAGLGSIPSWPIIGPSSALSMRPRKGS